MMDKSLIATPDWLEDQIKHLADCVNTTNKKGRVFELLKKMKGMRKHHAKDMFRGFIDNCDRFPSIKDFNQRIAFYENQDQEDFQRLEKRKQESPKYKTCLKSEMMIAARPMKLLLKKDPKKFNQIKDVYDQYFPNILSEANNQNSNVENKDLRVNACFNLMNDFYNNPKKVFQDDIDNRSPGIVKQRLIEGLRVCQSSKDFFGTTAKSC